MPETPLPREGAANQTGGIALLELFAGLRTAHLAAKQENLPVVASLSAEIDDYANELAKKNHPESRCIGDVKKLDKTAIGAWIAAAYLAGAVVAIIVAGFPCKGTSRLRKTGGYKAPNLDDAQSNLFYEIPRIRDEVSRAIRALQPPDTPKMKLRIIVENVIIDDKKTLREVSDKLGCEPLRIEAGRLLAANRERIYWCDYAVKPTSAEQFRDRDGFKELLVAKQEKAFVPALGWFVHPKFTGRFPTVVGWVERPREPDTKRTAGFASATPEAIARWRKDGWLTNLSWYKNENMLWPTKTGTARNRFPPERSPQQKRSSASASRTTTPR